jgi:hypothetical protein
MSKFIVSPGRSGLVVARVYPVEVGCEAAAVSCFSCFFTAGASGSSGASLRNFLYAAIAVFWSPPFSDASASWIWSVGSVGSSAISLR